jgi:hypothetical protein
MSLKDYLATLQAVVAATPFVVSISLSYEERPPTAGFIKGTVFFTDGSQVDFKEFVVAHPALRVIKYAYHYRKGENLVFRYDNANDPAARTLPTYPSHKHTFSGMLAVEQPTLEQVLREIVLKLNP